MSSLRCVECKHYLFREPMQCPCGDRLCGGCFENYRSSNKTKIICPRCQTDFLLSDCFRDIAATMELKKAIIQCESPGCPWEGKSERYVEHSAKCREKFPTSVTSSSPPKHCVYVYDKNISHLQFSAAELETGCNDDDQGPMVEDDYHSFSAANGDCENHLNGHYNLTHHVDVDARSRITRQTSDLKSEISRELALQLQPMASAVAKTEASIEHLQRGFAEMTLMMEMFQATTSNGTFLWKIPDLQRRRREAETGKTVSLYSPPFYTGPHGYKMCLRAYLNGDGVGKGSHLSLFFVLMKGEYDAINEWPFKQKVTLMLLDQDHRKHIVQAFKPTPESPSFQQPQAEMNVASGCPRFAPLAVLDNPSYVKDDTMFLKCKIDTVTLDINS